MCESCKSRKTKEKPKGKLGQPFTYGSSVHLLYTLQVVVQFRRILYQSQHSDAKCFESNYLVTFGLSNISISHVRKFQVEIWQYCFII